MQVLTLESLAKQGALAGKRVLIRSDLNAPRDEAGNITDETRLIASVPAFRLVWAAGAAVMVMSTWVDPPKANAVRKILWPASPFV